LLPQGPPVSRFEARGEPNKESWLETASQPHPIPSWPPPLKSVQRTVWLSETTQGIFGVDGQVL
jgi:hypothetical protein